MTCVHPSLQENPLAKESVFQKVGVGELAAHPPSFSHLPSCAPLTQETGPEPPARTLTEVSASRETPVPPLRWESAHERRYHPGAPTASTIGTQ